MVAHRRQDERLRKLLAALAQDLSQEAPKLSAMAVADAERDQRPAEGREAFEERAADALRNAGADPVHAVQGPAVIFSWTVKGPQDALVALNQARRRHLGNEVE